MSTLPVLYVSEEARAPATTGELVLSPSRADVVALLLEDKRSPATRRAYEGDLRGFFAFLQKTPEEFLGQSTPTIALDLAVYKAGLRGSGLAEATINRRLAAAKSLLKFAHRLGLCETDGRGLVDGEKVRNYRDTRGIDLKLMRKLVKAPAKRFGDTVRGLRDTAILLLLCENALRRAEVCALDTLDYDSERKVLSILGKGRGTQKEQITISTTLDTALGKYLRAKPEAEVLSGSTSKSTSGGALFENCDRRPEYSGRRLTPDGLYQLIGFYGREIGLKRLTPHQLRHSAITAALDATKGDVRKVQKLSRHLKIEVLMIYDDNREDHQGEVSGLLSRLLG